MREIFLTKGKIAIVDEKDYNTLNRHRWQAKKDINTWYAIRSIQVNKVRYTLSMHRVIMNALTGQIVDHKNMNGLDNRNENLRLCNYSQSKGNTTKCRRKCSSKFKGVNLRKKNGKWTSSIGSGKARIFLGDFQTEQEAAEAYNTAALKHYGKFAKLNIL